jgi:diacylglycerol O-acyltransferase 2, plant
LHKRHILHPKQDQIHPIGFASQAGGAASGWRFFQPFEGGTAFVATQGLGWALFSLSLLAIMWLVTQVAAGVAYCLRCWVVATGGVMFAAQLVR